MTNQAIENLFSSKTTNCKYKLMLKCHWATGVNYLCITKRDKYREYRGSGVRWNILLKSIPSPITTNLLFSSDDIEEFNANCKEHSDLFNLPHNPDFANLVPEYGYEGNQGNFKVWWDNATEEQRQEVYVKRTIGIINNHWIHSSQADLICSKISVAQSNNWYKNLEIFLSEHESNTVEDFNTLKTSHVRLAAKEKFDNLTDDEYDEYCNLLSEKALIRWENMTE